MAGWQNKVAKRFCKEATRDRIRFVAEVLRLDPSEVEPVLADVGSEFCFKVLEFAKRHGQSLDWLFLGDVRGLIASRPLKCARE